MSNKLPKDLGIKIASKERAFWLRIKENCEQQLLENTQSSLILEKNLELAETKLEEYAR